MAAYASAAAVATDCRAARLETPLPLSAVAAMAARMSARFALVTPVMPKAARSAAVRAGDGVPPLAVNMIAWTMSARFDNSAEVSTAVAALPSMTSLSSAAAAAVSIWVIPIDANCEALIDALSLAPLPSAPVIIAAHTPDIVTGADAAPVLPAASVALAVKLCALDARAGETTRLQLPEPSTEAVPKSVVPS